MPNDTNETDWEAFMEDANEEFLEAFERNVEAQATFVETWMDALEGATEEDRASESLDGYAKAYQAWMDAAEEQMSEFENVLEGEEVSMESFRHRWLNAANEAFKEMMSTTAFAAATGETVESVMDLKEQTDEFADETLHTLGFATARDLEEVGERLVELERRQQDVEEDLEEVLETLENVDGGVGDVTEGIDGLEARLDDIEAELESIGDQQES
ncbi:MAG: poly(R)-hydroxyalkanoic acid synthase subunit PhaE [Halodesulfurarchaeum sp.]